MKAREVDLRLQKSLTVPQIRVPHSLHLTVLSPSAEPPLSGSKVSWWQTGCMRRLNARTLHSSLWSTKRKSERELTLYCRAIFNTCHMLKREGDPRFTYSQGMTNPSCERGNLEPRQKEAPMPQRRNLAQVTGGQGSRKREPCQESLWMTQDGYAV